MSQLTPFDAYEIHPVVQRRMPDGSSFAEQTDDPAEARRWSLFGHIPGQGLECIGDFPSYDLAAEIYARITGHAYDAAAPVGNVGTLLDTLRLARHALNEAPSFRLRHARYRSSYQVSAALEAVLREFTGGSG